MTGASERGELQASRSGPQPADRRGARAEVGAHGEAAREVAREVAAPGFAPLAEGPELGASSSVQQRAVSGLTLATYNVHGWVGADGRRDPARVGRVLAELEADVIGLQEVDLGPRVHGLAEDPAAKLAAELGYRAVEGPTLRRGQGTYGNALFTRRPVRRVRRIDLSVPGREPRGALAVELEWDGAPLELVVTHLGLSGPERVEQVERLLAATAAPGVDRRPLVLLGDWNEWNRSSQLLRRLRVRVGPTKALATFPARFPALALDRIWVRPSRLLSELRVHKSALARVASDHLPVVARLER